LPLEFQADRPFTNDTGLAGWVGVASVIDSVPVLIRLALCVHRRAGVRRRWINPFDIDRPDRQHDLV